MIKSAGYKIFNKYITNNSIYNISKGFYKICKFVEPTIFNQNFNNFENKNFNKKLINLRKKNKKSFSRIYDLMQYSSLSKKFCEENSLNKLALKILGCGEECLFLRTQFRIDVPSDKRNVFDWHQDSAYDKLNSTPTNGIIFWVPLINVNKLNGSLIIKPFSHVEKNHFVTKVKFGLKYKSPQLTVPTKKLKKYKTFQLELKKKDLLVTYANLFHKSGFNSSDHVRYTLILRYNNICKKDFVVFKK